MSGVPVILLPGEGFTVLRETAIIRVTFFISQDYQYSLYIMETRLAAVPEDIVGSELVAVLDENVVAIVEPV